MSGRTAWRILAALMVLSLMWSLWRLKSKRGRFHGWPNDQSLRQSAELSRHKKVCCRIAVHYLLQEFAAGSSVLVPRSMRREVKALETMAGIKASVRKRILLDRSVVDPVRGEADFERDWLGRSALFFFEKDSNEYVLSDVSDGSLIWLPRPMLERLRTPR